MTAFYIGSGVLPIAIHQGKAYLLLGREVNSTDSNGTWCSFGGGLEENESITDNAIREFMEESMALIMSEGDIRLILTENRDNCLLARYQVDQGRNKPRYLEHLVLIDYDADLPLLFERVYRQFNSCAQSLSSNICMINNTDTSTKCLPLFEKDRIKWFSLDYCIKLANKMIKSEEIGPCDLKLRYCFAETIAAASSVIYSSIKPPQIN